MRHSLFLCVHGTPEGGPAFPARFGPNCADFAKFTPPDPGRGRLSRPPLQAQAAVLTAGQNSGFMAPANAASVIPMLAFSAAGIRQQNRSAHRPETATSDYSVWTKGGTKERQKTR